jgi:hypothetical protein
MVGDGVEGDIGGAKRVGIARAVRSSDEARSIVGAKRASCI